VKVIRKALLSDLFGAMLKIQFLSSLPLPLLIVLHNPFRERKRCRASAELLRKAAGIRDIKTVHIWHSQIGFQKRIDDERMELFSCRGKASAADPP